MTAIAQPFADRTPLLRRALLTDAVFVAMSGAVFAAGAAPLEALLGIPSAVLLAIGLVLLPYAAFIAYAGTRPTISRVVVWLNIVLGVIWIVDSVALLALGWLPLTAAGWWTVVGLAVVVEGMVVAQYLGLRRARG